MDNDTDYLIVTPQIYLYSRFRFNFHIIPFHFNYVFGLFIICVRYWSSIQKPTQIVEYKLILIIDQSSNVKVCWFTKASPQSDCLLH